MASGSEDWRIRTDTDIVAQTVGNISVDVVAQALAAMNIDITAQTLDTLDIDVVAQTISQLIQRPKYGSASYSYSSVAVGANDTETIWDISGQGKCYGGYVRIIAGGTHYDDALKLTIDGDAMYSVSFDFLKDTKMYDPKYLYFHLVNYDEENGIYQANFHPDLTFESSFKFEYEDKSGAALTVYSLLFYAVT